MTDPTIDFIYINAGGGHRATALALQAVIAQQRRPWNVRLIDLGRVLDPQAQFRRMMGFDAEQFYNLRLQRGWTLGLAQELKLLQGGIRWAQPTLLRTLTAHWARTEPDLVVSLVPNFNRVLCRSVAAALPGVPFVTVLTDMADHPPAFWIEPEEPQQIVVCGTEHAAAQARAAGVDAARVSRTSGMVIKPSFYNLRPIDRDAARRALGLDPGRCTGAVMFGGQGSSHMLRIARELPNVQLLLLCGGNEPLAQRLRELQRPAPHAVVGFTEDVPSLLRLADFFIGKPGPGCLSEAVRLGLPPITLRNAWTMPQERYNTQWVQERGVGLVIRRLDALSEAVAQMQSRLEEMRATCEREDNRAVFEVPDLLGALLGDDGSSRPGHLLDRRRLTAA